MQRRWVRVLWVLGAVSAVAAAGWLLYGTQAGEAIRRNDPVRHWIEAQPALAPLLFVAAYGVVGTLALPVWWLQIIAGYCFGLVMGLVWCHLGAVISSTATVAATQALLGGWMTTRMGSYRNRLARFQRKLGNNGLLVVTAVRISHVMPFGISNYLFGLTRIRIVDVILGTVLGGTLSQMIHIAAGANPRLLISPGFLGILAAINLVLLSPLVVGYWQRARRAAEAAG